MYNQGQVSTCIFHRAVGQSLGGGGRQIHVYIQGQVSTCQFHRAVCQSLGGGGR